MEGFKLDYALFKIFKMVTSRKFLVLLFACLAVYGLDIPEQTQALVFFVCASLFAALTAYEDRGA